MEPLVFWSIACIATLFALGSLLAFAHLRRLKSKLVDLDARFNLVMDTVPEGYWDWSIATDQMFVSPGYAKMLGVDAKELTYRYGICESLIHPEDRDAALSAAKGSISQNTAEFQQVFRLRSKHNGYRHVLCCGKVVESDRFGKAARVVGTQTDITDLKKAQAEHLQQDRSEQQLIQYRSNFLATISHEIRTPMNAISGLSHLVLQSHLTDAQRNDVSNILRSSQKLLNTVNDVFELSQLESGQTTIESIDFHLYDVFEPLANSFHFQEISTNIDLAYEIGDPVPKALFGDPLRIGQLLSHLINKLIETSGQHQFKLTVQLLDQKSATPEINFSINGLQHELHPASPELAIQTNQSLTDSSNPYARRGLGLAICKRLIKLMQGKLHVELENPSIAHCSFSVPLSNASTSSIQRRFECPAQFQKLSILIVEPDIESAVSLQLLLKSFLIDSCHCRTGNEAIQIIKKLEQGPFELLILGPGLSKEQSVLTQKQINSLYDGISAPAVLEVSTTNPSDVTQTLTVLPDKPLLLKPITPAALYKSITKLLESHRKSRLPESLNQSQPKQSHSRILLVEDNRVNQQVAREILLQMGADVSIANNGREALKQLQHEQFALVLMDIQMPKMDGLTATRAIRSNPNLIGLPIIAMTAHATQSDRNIALASGMDDFVSKPIDGPTLYKTLQRWIHSGIHKPIQAIHAAPLYSPAVAQLADAIEIKTGLSHVGNDQAFYLKLLREFHRDHQSDGQIIEKALHAGDFETAKRITHTLTGISANIGAKTLYQQANALYTQIHTNNHDNLSADLDNFLQAFSDIMQKLEKIDNSTKTRKDNLSEVQPDRRMLKEVLAHLDVLLQQGDSEALELMEKIKIQLDFFELDDQVDELGHLINYFRFDDARRILDKIAVSLKLKLSA